MFSEEKPIIERCRGRWLLIEFLVHNNREVLGLLYHRQICVRSVTRLAG